ncbi:hypothetical protein [Burkholderia anthina]|uniref:hypothetical protein n=1 Tax=Burkholderia anthina TaxID=179879 RepID=UPI001FC8650A|nr:hypothetical protein [Burkholderia anthina]
MEVDVIQAFGAVGIMGFSPQRQAGERADGPLGSQIHFGPGVGNPARGKMKKLPDSSFIRGAGSARYSREPSCTGTAPAPNPMKVVLPSSASALPADVASAAETIARLLAKISRVISWFPVRWIGGTLPRRSEGRIIGASF